jgi:hypothetical protein
MLWFMHFRSYSSLMTADKMVTNRVCKLRAKFESIYVEFLDIIILIVE